MEVVVLLQHLTKMLEVVLLLEEMLDQQLLDWILHMLQHHQLGIMMMEF